MREYFLFAWVLRGYVFILNLMVVKKPLFSKHSCICKRQITKLILSCTKLVYLSAQMSIHLWAKLPLQLHLPAAMVFL